MTTFSLFSRNVSSSTTTDEISLCRMSEEVTTTSAASAASTEEASTSQHNHHVASDSSDSGCALEEYTWVPHGLRPQQVGKKILILIGTLFWSCFYTALTLF